MATLLSAPPFPCSSSSTGESRRVYPISLAPAIDSCSTVSLGESYADGAALSTYYREKEKAYTPSIIGQFYNLLERCIQDEDVVQGEEVYTKIMESGLNMDSFLGCHLIRMFTIFGDLETANEVFGKLQEPSVFAWSAIITAHATLGRSERAIEMYFEMRSLPLEPDGHVFVAVLQACASAGSLLNGILVHDDIIEIGLSSSVYVGNTLIGMYAKCGSLKDAYLFFNKMPERDVVTWNSMIGGFCEHGDVQGALQTFWYMSEESFQPNNVSCICCLSACSNCAAVEQGRELHAYTVEQGRELHAYIAAHGFDSDVQVFFALIEMYIACGYLDDARSVFDKGRKDTETVDFMVTAYSLHGHDQEAIELLQNMQKEGILCTTKSLISSLRACGSLEDLDQGWIIHSNIVESGFDHDKFVSNTLIDFYGKCGRLDDAKVVFNRLQHQDVVSWSALISGFTGNAHFEDALTAFREMKENGLKPNEITFTCILKACSGTAGMDNGMEHGRWIHSLIVGEGFEQNLIIGGSLVDLYTKCGNLEDACIVFGKLPNQDVVIWSAMILGFVQHGYGQEALQCFKTMQSRGMEPTTYTIVAVLKACSVAAALEQARQIHKYTICRGLESESIIGGALVDMYARCGCLRDACAVFHSLQSPDIISWGTMITSFAQHNDYESAVECFHEMEKHGHPPNTVIFTCLLTACCHANRIEEGCCHFKSIREHYSLLPTLEHYYCMVELLGHGGHFDEAEDLIESVPFQSTIVGWISLLASCRRHGNVELGKRCFQNAVRINPGYSSEYRLMQSLYNGAGLLDDAEQIEELRISANAWKKPAKAFIEIDNQVHGFIVGDKTHPQSGDIYAKIDALSDKIKNAGFKPKIASKPTELGSVKEKDDTLIHSEKLAIALGLISTPEGATIRLSKNLRVCADCHATAKAISKVEMRDIIITDAYQIHHFHDGACSCANWW